MEVGLLFYLLVLGKWFYGQFVHSIDQISTPRAQTGSSHRDSFREALNVSVSICNPSQALDINLVNVYKWAFPFWLLQQPVKCDFLPFGVKSYWLCCVISGQTPLTKLPVEDLHPAGFGSKECQNKAWVSKGGKILWKSKLQEAQTPWGLFFQLGRTLQTPWSDHPTLGVSTCPILIQPQLWQHRKVQTSPLICPELEVNCKAENRTKLNSQAMNFPSFLPQEDPEVMSWCDTAINPAWCLATTASLMAAVGDTQLPRSAISSGTQFARSHH